MKKISKWVTAFLWLASQAHAGEYTLHTFAKIQLTDKFWSETATLGDLNRDGHDDIVYGPYWYEGPAFKKRHEYYSADRTFISKRTDGSQLAIEGYEGALGSGIDIDQGELFVKVADVNRDGWPDILSVGWIFPGIQADRAPQSPAAPAPLGLRILSWYENPGAASAKGRSLWKQHPLAYPVGNYSIDLVDLFGDGAPVLIAVSGEHVGYFSADPNNLATWWTFHPISSKSGWPWHGLGYGDINGDGRNDVVHADGWWEQPTSLANDPQWAYHPYSFGLGPAQVKLDGALFDVSPDGLPASPLAYGGSHMYVDDVNDDGRADVVASVTAHGYGLAWWQQLKEQGPMGLQFRRHLIINREPNENKYGVKFTQMQALAWADMDGDGLKDIVTGKRFWGHGKCCVDPESDAAAVLYWFKQVHHADKSVEFIPYLIDDNSGAGTQITTGDVNDDGRRDIVVGSKKGGFVFLQEAKIVSKMEWEKAQPPILFPHAQTDSSLQRRSNALDAPVRHR